MISVDLTKARAIAHGKRRAARAAEFSPLDDLISKRIPGTDEAAVEAQRQAVRERYTAIQQAINSASTADELMQALQGT